jgi:hypothetical protein
MIRGTFSGAFLIPALQQAPFSQICPNFVCSSPTAACFLISVIQMS